MFIADRKDEDEEEEEEEVQEEQEEEKYVLKNKSGLVNVTLCLIVVVWLLSNRIGPLVRPLYKRQTRNRTFSLVCKRTS